MSIADEFHKSYYSMTRKWKRCRDAREGQDAVHDAGEIYLPKLGDQTDDDYEAMKLRARFFNAVSKTISGYVGLVMRTPAVIDYPEAMEPIGDNIDRTGAGIDAFIKKTLDQVLEVGRCGTLLDYSRVEEGATQADTAGTRPFWVQYLAEDIINWKYTDGVLVRVVLREELDDEDQETLDAQYRIRELFMDGSVYRQNEYLIKRGETEAVLIGTTTPIKNDAPFDEIPFFFHQPEFSQSIELPPLIDLVDLNFAHYRTEADHSHALHLAALPTPYVIGVDPEDPNAPRSIGPQKLWLIADPSAKVGMLEYTGAGVSSIADKLTKMEEQMAMLGARMLMSEAGVDNTATATKIRSISETSDLASIVGVLNKQFDNLLQLTAEWAGFEDETTLTISKNFLPPELDGSKLLAIVQAWLHGAYDYRTMAENLQKAEIIDPNADIDEIRALTETETSSRNDAEMAKIEAAAANQAPTEETQNEDTQTEDEQPPE